jgi:curved DNA-binding protein CbpA
MEHHENLPDLYDILGLTPDVSLEPNCSEIIRKAYLRRAKKYHPDKNSDVHASQMFGMLSLAFQILSNEQKREEYNRNRYKDTVQEDFNKLKSSSLKFLGNMSQKGSPDPQKFHNHMEELDKKHGYQTFQDKPITKEEAHKRMDQIMDQIKGEKDGTENHRSQDTLNEQTELAKPLYVQPWNKRELYQKYSELRKIGQLYDEEPLEQ